MIFPNARIRRFKLYKTFLLLIVFLFVIVLSIFLLFLGVVLLHHNIIFFRCSNTTPYTYIIAKQPPICKHYFNAFSFILKSFLHFLSIKREDIYHEYPQVLAKFFGLFRNMSDEIIPCL